MKVIIIWTTAELVEAIQQGKKITAVLSEDMQKKTAEFMKDMKKYMDESKIVPTILELEDRSFDGMQKLALAHLAVNNTESMLDIVGRTDFYKTMTGDMLHLKELTLMSVSDGDIESLADLTDACRLANENKNSGYSVTCTISNKKLQEDIRRFADAVSLFHDELQLQVLPFVDPSKLNEWGKVLSFFFETGFPDRDMDSFQFELVSEEVEDEQLLNKLIKNGDVKFFLSKKQY